MCVCIRGRLCVHDDISYLTRPSCSFIQFFHFILLFCKLFIFDILLPAVNLCKIHKLSIGKYTISLAFYIRAYILCTKNEAKKNIIIYMRTNETLHKSRGAIIRLQRRCYAFYLFINLFTFVVQVFV